MNLWIERDTVMSVLMTCATICISLLAAPASDATTFQRLSLPDLASEAEAVVRARCVSSQSRWEGGEIWTFTELEIVESLKGTVPRLVTVRMLGGRVGHLHSIVEGAPAFRAGEEVFLFLASRAPDSFSVLGWAQGTFRIRNDAQTGQESVTQDSAGMAVFDPATRLWRHDGIRNLPVEKFRQKVSETIVRGRQP